VRKRHTDRKRERERETLTKGNIDMCESLDYEEEEEVHSTREDPKGEGECSSVGYFGFRELKTVLRRGG